VCQAIGATGRRSAWSLAPGGEEVPLGSLCRFRLAALRLSQAIMMQSVTCVCYVYAMMLYLDQEMLCHERVGSWMVVNT